MFETHRTLKVLSEINRLAPTQPAVRRYGPSGGRPIIDLALAGDVAVMAALRDGIWWATLVVDTEDGPVFGDPEMVAGDSNKYNECAASILASAARGYYALMQVAVADESPLEHAERVADLRMRLSVLVMTLEQRGWICSDELRCAVRGGEAA